MYRETHCRGFALSGRPLQLVSSLRRCGEAVRLHPDGAAHARSPHFMPESGSVPSGLRQEHAQGEGVRRQEGQRDPEVRVVRKAVCASSLPVRQDLLQVEPSGAQRAGRCLTWIKGRGGSWA